MKTFESKYGNLDDNLNHRAPPQDARPSAQDQRPLSLSFTNGCPYHSPHKSCSNAIEQNIHTDHN